MLLLGGKLKTNSSSSRFRVKSSISHNCFQSCLDKPSAVPSLIPFPLRETTLRGLVDRFIDWQMNVNTFNQNECFPEP